MDTLSKLGGKLVSCKRMDSSTTHLLFQEGSIETWELAQQLRLFCVKPEWVELCDDCNKRQKEKFCLATPPLTSPKPTSVTPGSVPDLGSGGASGPRARTEVDEDEEVEPAEGEDNGLVDDDVEEACSIEERGRQIIDQIVEQARTGGRKRRVTISEPT